MAFHPSQLLSSWQSIMVVMVGSSSPNKFEYSFSRTVLNIVVFQSEETLYDPTLLSKLDFYKSPVKFEPFISAAAPGEPWMKVRPLQDGDYEKGFMQLLGQLTETGPVSKTQFLSE